MTRASMLLRRSEDLMGGVSGGTARELSECLRGRLGGTIKLPSPALLLLAPLLLLLLLLLLLGNRKVSSGSSGLSCCCHKRANHMGAGARPGSAGTGELKAASAHLFAQAQTREGMFCRHDKSSLRCNHGSFQGLQFIWGSASTCLVVPRGWRTFGPCLRRVLVLAPVCVGFCNRHQTSQPLSRKVSTSWPRRMSPAANDP